MVRGLRMNTNLSAWDQLNGVYDYSRTPLDPPGTRVLVHEKSHQRGTWAPHGKDAWYVVPSFEHYQSYKVWAWETRREHDTDTALTWFPHHVKMPTPPTALDCIAASLRDLAQALKHPITGLALAPITSSQIAAMDDLIQLFMATRRNDDDATAPPGGALCSPDAPPTLVLAPSAVVPINQNPASAPSPPVSAPPATLGPPRHSQRTCHPLLRPAHANNTVQEATGCDDAHWALHGTAMNPDTGQLAE